MNVDFELYDGKKFNDLLKDIVENSDNKRYQLDVIITELRDKIKTINDAIVLAPIIQTYLDISIKNDDSLVKLAAVIQRLISGTTSNQDGSVLSDTEKEQLLRDIKNLDLNIKLPIEKK